MKEGCWWAGSIPESSFLALSVEPVCGPYLAKILNFTGELTDEDICGPRANCKVCNCICKLMRILMTIDCKAITRH
jgi:hypothetical protein